MAKRGKGEALFRQRSALRYLHGSGVVFIVIAARIWVGGLSKNS
jgi:hypothetical protein